MNDTIRFRSALLVSLAASLALGILMVAGHTASPAAPAAVKAPHHSGPRCMECPRRGR